MKKVTLTERLYEAKLTMVQLDGVIRGKAEVAETLRTMSGEDYAEGSDATAKILRDLAQQVDKLVVEAGQAAAEYEKGFVSPLSESEPMIEFND